MYRARAHRQAALFAEKPNFEKSTLSVTVPYGKGKIVAVGFDIGSQYLSGTQYLHRELMKDITSSLQVRYVGWDMVITPDGVDLIEANDNADHALFGRIGCQKLFLNQLKSLE